LNQGGRPSRDDLALYVLAVAMVAYVAIALWLTRGITFINDETRFVALSKGFGLESLLTPHNGHLILPTRVLYSASLALFGTGHGPIRVVEAAGVVVVAAVLFAQLRHRVPPAVALAPTLVVLFLGSSAGVVLSPVGISAVLSTAAGLAALLMLDRGTRRADVAACALLAASVASFSSGLSFMAAACVWLLLDGNRRRRLWVVGVPLLLYAAWLIWATRFDQGTLALSHLLLIPGFIGDGLAAAVSAMTGLSYLGPSAAVTGASQVLAVLGVVALTCRVALVRPRRRFWALLAFPIAFWASIALSADFFRNPAEPRYLFFGVLGITLVAAEAWRATVTSNRALAILFGLLTLSLTANLLALRDAGRTYRSTSVQTRAVLGSYQLAGINADPGYRYGFNVPVTASQYLTGGARNGFYGFTPTELRARPAAIRALADDALAGALKLSVKPAAASASGDCTRSEPGAGLQSVALPLGGAVIGSDSAANVRIGRFADAPDVDLGALPPGGSGAISIPADSEPTPWRVTVDSPGRVKVCPPAHDVGAG
jgi:hypothetical protein